MVGDHPPPPDTQAIGEEWITQEMSAVLTVPSVIIPSERNYLINPLHSDFNQIRIGPTEVFEFDPRLTV